jgi:hypothetical protein
MFNKLLVIGLAIALALSATAGFAQQVKKQAKEKKGPISAMKIVQGQVTWIGNGRIAIVYKKDAANKSEEEILLPFDKNVELEHLRQVSDISAGNIVSIIFEEVSEERPDGPRLIRKAKKIGFIRKGVKIAVGEKEEKEEKERKEAGEGVLKSE